MLALLRAFLATCVVRPSSLRARMGIRMRVRAVLSPCAQHHLHHACTAAWHASIAAPGDWVNQDDVVVVLETDKVSVEVRAPTAGFLDEQLAATGATVAVGSPLAKLRAGEKPAAAAAAAAPAKAAPTPAAPAAPAAAAPAAPAAKASETPAAKPAPAPAKPAAAGASAAAAKAAAPAPGSRTENRVAMNRMRLRIAQRLKESQNTAAMLTTFQECDMSALFELREKYKEQFEKVHGAKLGFMSPFLKAAAAQLVEMPVMNAVIDGSDVRSQVPRIVPVPAVVFSDVCTQHR